MTNNIETQESIIELAEVIRNTVAKFLEGENTNLEFFKDEDSKTNRECLDAFQKHLDLIQEFTDKICNIDISLDNALRALNGLATYMNIKAYLLYRGQSAIADKMASEIDELTEEYINSEDVPASYHEIFGTFSESIDTTGKATSLFIRTMFLELKVVQAVKAYERSYSGEERQDILQRFFEPDDDVIEIELDKYDVPRTVHTRDLRGFEQVMGRTCPEFNAYLR